MLFLSKLQATELLNRFFRKIKVKKNIYSPVVEGLVETSLRGVDSHGIRLAPHYIRATLLGRINPSPVFKTVRNGLSVMQIDADHTYGISAGIYAMKKAIKLAKKTGIAAVSVLNSTHFAAAGIYGKLAADNGLIGIAMTNVEDLVVPYGGRETFLGTNAYCFAAPMAGEGPYLLDMATSKISFNRLLISKKNNLVIKDGSAVDESGNYTNDPKKAVGLTAFGEYKGFGIQTQIEIMCSLLTGMPFGPFISHMFPLDRSRRKLAHFFIAINIAAFTNPNKFKLRLKQMSEMIRQIKPARGVKNVRMAGDRSKLEYKKRIIRGIPLYPEVEKEFKVLASELGLKLSI